LGFYLYSMLQVLGQKFNIRCRW